MCPCVCSYRLRVYSRSPKFGNVWGWSLHWRWLPVHFSSLPNPEPPPQPPSSHPFLTLTSVYGLTNDAKYACDIGRQFEDWIIVMCNFTLADALLWIPWTGLPSINVYPENIRHTVYTFHLFYSGLVLFDLPISLRTTLRKLYRQCNKLTYNKATLKMNYNDTSVVWRYSIYLPSIP